MLITLGDQDIDLSPSFVIFLSTRDPTVSSGTLPWISMMLLGLEPSEATSLFPVLTGGVPTGSLFPGDFCELHSHPQQSTEPVSQ